MRREGISTPTHPSYSTGSTLKRKDKVARNCSQTAHTLEGNTDGRRKKVTRQNVASWSYVVCHTNIRVDVVRGQGKRAR
jgi:hypothetical protein